MHRDSRPVVDKLTYEFYRSVKRSASCVYQGCGRQEDLEFHHVDPKTKVDTVCTIARTGTLEQLMKELKKCVPLCSQHHRGVHEGRIKGWLKGQFDNGKASNDLEARHFMPFRPYLESGRSLYRN